MKLKMVAKPNRRFYKDAVDREDWPSAIAYLIQSKRDRFLDCDEADHLVASIEGVGHKTFGLYRQYRERSFAKRITRADVDFLQQLPALLHGAGMGADVNGARERVAELAVRIDAMLPQRDEEEAR